MSTKFDERVSNLAGSSLRISIAMATYNGEKYIREQLDSIAAQTLLPCELVVTDDGSRDETLKIIEEFSANAPFEVRIYCNENRLGFANNFLKAASLCNGELIAFSDQDDKWVGSKLEFCCREFVDGEVLLCVHSSVVWKNEMASVRRWPDFKTRLVLHPNTSDPLTVYPGFSMMIRASILSKIAHAVRPTNIHSLPHTRHPMSHDQWAWFVSSIFGKIVCLPNSLAFYRQHSQNVYGAGESRRGLQTLFASMRSLNYQGLAELSEEYGGFLESAMPLLPEQLRSGAFFAADKFRRRARLQRLRAQIYDETLGIMARLRAFLKILSLGGYMPDRSRALLGPRAALKDILFGVPGVFILRI